MNRYDENFSDFIKLYENINDQEWITLFEENDIPNKENDIFTFCALVDKSKIED